jgi:hypothetical protein
MPDIELLVKIAAGAAAIWAGDKVLKKTTGKGIVEWSVYGWRRLRDRITAWLAEHPEMRGRPLLTRIVEKTDDLTVRVMQVAVKKADGRGTLVTQDEVPMEEVLKRFPHLANNVGKWAPIELEQLA